MKHILLHMNKSIAKISTELELFDHGDKMDIEVINTATVKMIINSLKLADEIGLNAKDLSKKIPEIMEPKLTK